MTRFITVGTKQVELDPQKNISMDQVLQENDPELFFRSVFITRQGETCIEEYDGNYDAAGGNDEDKFPKLREQIIQGVLETYPLLEEAGYFEPGALETVKRDYIPFNFYTSPHGHLYDAIYVDNDFNLKDVMMDF